MVACFSILSIFDNVVDEMKGVGGFDSRSHATRHRRGIMVQCIASGKVFVEGSA